MNVDLSDSGPTLPDYLGPGLTAISVGLNPSPMSTKTGVYFANPRNRFWSALRGAGLLPPHFQASPAAMRYLYETAKIGFTDVVKRTTPGAAQLRAADYRRWAPDLREKLEALRPQVVWFHGKVAYEGFYRHAFGSTPALQWGRQSSPWADMTVFVSPNPSPANAAYSLEDLVGWYRQLGDCLADNRRLSAPSASKAVETD